MGDIRIAGRLARKRSVKNTSGQIIDLLDETNGGWIIKGGQVVNPEKYQEMLQKEQDRRDAAKAQAEAISRSAEIEAQRMGKASDVPTQPNGLESRVTGLENKLDAILEAINSNKKT